MATRSVILLVFAFIVSVFGTPIDVNLDITGGTDASSGCEFPYQVGISASVSNGDRLCSGALLNDHWIITAARCVEDTTVVLLDFGADNILNSSEIGHIEAHIKKDHIYVHPEWNPATGANNLALLEMGKFHSIPFDDYTRPIDLPRISQKNETFEGFTGNITGWGRHSMDEEDITFNLRYIELPIISNSECKKSLALHITESNLCARSPKQGSVCEGDVGDPIAVKDKDGKLILIGLTSSLGMQSACRTGSPAVFTRITSYLDWISATSGIELNP